MLMIIKMFQISYSETFCDILFNPKVNYMIQYFPYLNVERR
jgi:hypothetical protein